MKDDLVFLQHIDDEIKYILKKTEKLTFDHLMDDETLQRALSRSLEIIGEATKNLSDNFKDRHPEVEWKKIAGLRDKLIHSYFGVDWYTVWDVVRIRIPELEKQLDKLIKG